MLPDRLQKLCKTQKLRPLPWPDRTRRPLLTLWPSDSLVCPPGSEIRCSNSMSKNVGECKQACMVIGPFGQRTALIFRQIGRCGQSGRKKHAQWLMLSCLGTIQTPPCTDLLWNNTKSSQPGTSGDLYIPFLWEASSAPWIYRIRRYNCSLKPQKPLQTLTSKALTYG